MTIEEAIRAHLTASPYPTVLGPRWYSHKAPQTPTEPYGVIYRVSPRPIMAHTGPAGIIERAMQLSLFGKQQSVVLGAGDALRRMINGFRGTMGGLDVRAVIWQNERYMFNETSGLHQVAHDFLFSYVEE